MHESTKQTSNEEMIPFIEPVLPPSQVLEDFEKEVEALLTIDADFIKRVVAALIESTSPPDRTEHHGLIRNRNQYTSEYVCKKHGHHGWCARMEALAKYTRFAINYHRAKKRVHGSDYYDHRFEPNKYMKIVCLYGGMKAEARIQYYSTECNCGGLGTNTEFEFRNDKHD